MSEEATRPTWVTDALNWPTPHDCQLMSPAEAEEQIGHYADEAIHAQILVDHHTRRRDWFTEVARRIAAVHPKAADAVARKARR